MTNLKAKDYEKILATSLILVAGSFIFSRFFDNSVITSVFRIAYAVSMVTALFYMLQKGSLIASKKIGAVMIATGLVFLGVIMKIMHLQGADWVFLVSSLAVIIIYLLHYIAKAGKKLLDHFKMLWVVLFLGGWLFHVMHIINGKYIVFIGHILFWLMFLVFYLQARKASRTAVETE